MEEVNYFDKITLKIEQLCFGLNMDYVDPLALTLQIKSRLSSESTTAELNNLAAKTAAEMTVKHPDYGILAGRLAVSNLHKETKECFSEVIDDLYNMVNDETKQPTPMISEFHHSIVMKHASRLNSAIIHDRDFSYNYCEIKIFEKSCLLKVNGIVAERPQHMFMRIAVGIHGEDIDAIIETYNLLSEKYFIFPLRNLLNAATCNLQCPSCFLLQMKGATLHEIKETYDLGSQILKLSKNIGMYAHCIESEKSTFAETKVLSAGLVTALKVYNSCLRWFYKDNNKKPGGTVVYVEPWHADIFKFLDFKKNLGKKEIREKDLMPALWINDLFMERVEKNEYWCLMCPSRSQKLDDCWGNEFEQLYLQYEKEGKYVEKIKARKLWKAICTSQLETGKPHMLYKDTCNRKSNHQNLGTIKCGSAFGEIVEYFSPEEIAVCTLASIALNKFVKPDKTYDFQELKEIAKIVTRHVNKIIDASVCSIEEADAYNKEYRPIGIGVHGFADALILMRYPFESPEAKKLNIQVFETIYYGALEASCELAESSFEKYKNYENSPVSKGTLQFDMWNVTPTGLWDWASLKEKISQHGVRNSLLLAVGPLGPTAQILGSNKFCEPYTSYFRKRKFSSLLEIFYHHLVKDLSDLKLWNDDMKNLIIANRESIQDIRGIPEELKDIYKTAYEISPKVLLEMAADRGAFIDGSQTLTMYIDQSTSWEKLSDLHQLGYKLGLKTGMVFLRKKPPAYETEPTAYETEHSQQAFVKEEDQNGTGDEKIMAAIDCSSENK